MATIMPGMPRDAGRSLVRSAARGAGLVGAAVILGIILLQVVDDGGSGPAGNGGDGNGTTVDTTDGDGDTTDTTVGDTRPPADVAVLALNASGVPQAAATLTNQLVAAGYTTLPAGDDPVQRQGTLVACREGFEADASALLVTVTAAGVASPAIDAFPADRTDLPGIADADCLVLIGT